MLEKCSSRGSAEFTPDFTAIYRHAFKDRCRRRRGNGQDAVCAFDLAAANMHGGDNYFIGSYLFHKCTEADDVRYRIHRSDFVKMYLRDITSVCLALGLCDKLVNGNGIGFNAF